MSDISISADAFGITVTQILDRLGTNVQTFTPPEVESALRVGQDAWKANARAVLSQSYSRGGWGKVRGGEKGVTRYRSGKRKGQIKSISWYGKTYKTGKYANSIKHHLMSSGGPITEGEIGSPSLPGLAHLLEKGHGGPGAAGAHPHIAEAYEVAARALENGIDSAVERAINAT